MTPMISLTHRGRNRGALRGAQDYPSFRSLVQGGDDAAQGAVARADSGAVGCGGGTRWSCTPHALKDDDVAEADGRARTHARRGRSAPGGQKLLEPTPARESPEAGSRAAGGTCRRCHGVSTGRQSVRRGGRTGVVAVIGAVIAGFRAAARGLRAGARGRPWWKIGKGTIASTCAERMRSSVVSGYTVA